MFATSHPFRSLPRSIAAIALVLVATAASAITLQEVASAASAMQASAADLLDRVETAAPQDRAALAAEHAALLAALDDLVEDRQSLGACSCTALDQAIAGVAGTLGDAQIIVDGWEM